MISLKIPPENKALLKSVKTYKKYQLILYNSARDKSVTNPSDKERMSRLFCDFFLQISDCKLQNDDYYFKFGSAEFFPFLFSLLSSLFSGKSRVVKRKENREDRKEKSTYKKIILSICFYQFFEFLVF